MTRLLVTVALLLAAPSIAEAQRRCTKGIPCGNTCIAAGRTCHVGTTPTPTRQDSTQATTPASITSQPAYPSVISGAPAAAPGTLVPPPSRLAGALQLFRGAYAEIRNAPISDKWLEHAKIKDVVDDHLVLVADEKTILIPLSSVVMFYSQGTYLGQLTIVLRK